MKKLLNVLYVMTQGSFLALEGETVVISVQNVKKGQIPLLNLQGIVCFGNIMCTPFLLGACAEHGIAVSFLTANGRFLARIQGGVCGNILLRRSQFLAEENLSHRSCIAAAFLLAKILNSRTVLQRFLRDHEQTLQTDQKERFTSTVFLLKHAADELGRQIENGTAVQISELMGKEGISANLYFSCFNDLITQKKDFSFTARTKRPPLDPVNAMLSFAYTLLAHDCTAALESVGLDPAAGFLHALRPGRDSLALDLMEEFRACLADRLVLSLINRNQISGKDFKTTDTGAVRMNDTSRRIFIDAWQERKQEEIMHPYLNEKIKIGLLPYLQALIFARFLRGDISSYPPFIYR